jgi:hypothetical protein
LQIGRQCAVANSRATVDQGHHFGAAGHLRHPFGRHKRSRFDKAQACAAELVDQLDLGIQWHRQLFVLQAVAWPDFHDLDPAL